MTIGFHLKSPPKANGEHGIFSYIRFPTGQCILYFPHLSVKSSHWSKKKQRVKPSVTNATSINDALDKIEGDLKDIIASLVQEHIEITPELVKSRFKALTTKDATRAGSKTFFDYWEDWIKGNTEGQKAKAPRTLVLYRGAMNRLKDYQNDRGAIITFSRIDVEFITSLSDYLIRVKDLQNGSIWQTVKTLKTFMKWAIDRCLTTNRAIEQVTKKQFHVKEPPVVRLSEEEFHRLTEHDFSTTPYLDNARNLFILQACLGVRVGDLLKIVQDPSSYTEGNSIRIVSGKTHKEQMIPLNNRAKRILFSESPPHHISDVKLNKYIKEAATIAGLDRVIMKTELRGKTVSSVPVPLYKEISSHCAKRTFVSLMVASGVHIQTIAEITGNTLDTIQRYILLDEKEIQREVKKAENVFS